MCGIFCEICNRKDNINKIEDDVMKQIMNRGPNNLQKISSTIGKQYKGIFCASVLWMYAPTLTPQPMEDSCGILLYNGDIFDEKWLCRGLSDTQIIMDKLYNTNKASSLDRHQDIISVLKNLKGPFSLMYYDKIYEKLYFTRDRIGRNSLLFHKNNHSIVISSVLGRKYKSYEVPATHIHCLDVDLMTITSHSWSTDLEETCDLTSWINSLEQLQSKADDQFHFEIDEQNLDDNEGIVQFLDLISQDSLSKEEIMTKVLDNIIIGKELSKLAELLEKSVKLRLEAQPQRCKECIDCKKNACNHCAVGVLFSGGLDCTLLAFLVDKYIHKDQPIDLINVAFNRINTENYEVPDRLTSVASFEELKRICPNRKWALRKVDVPLSELEKEQKDRIADLVYPRQTILDESLGSALWFAARAKDKEGVSSPCRVLILGSGADELFGGYTRHRNAFKRLGWSGLQKELTLDWKRISFRNLARDNRVICDHGRQPRMPYLDEDFTDFVTSLQPWFRCYPNENFPQGLGDKLMLRLLAFNYGLHGVATLPKRALQFGSRIANKKEKGSNISKNFAS